MNFIKLKSLAKEKRISLKQLAEMVEMSETGFHQAISNNSLRVDILEKIAQILGVPIGYFFDENYEQVNEPQATYNTRQSEKSLIAFLQAQVEYFQRLYEEEKKKQKNHNS